MTIFISKKVDDLELLNFFKDKNIELCAVSMISFNPTIFSIPEENDYEAVFFTSPRAVSFFLERVELPKNTFVGAIGKSTASFIYQQGYSVNFTGIRSGKPKEVAESFKAAVGDRKVLFPQSSRSKKSIQNYFKPEQCLNLVVYETLLESQELKNRPNVLVFTSPSNVEAFLQKNTLEKSQKIIAWGDSTALYLENKGYSVIYVLEKSNLQELRSVLTKILN